MLGSTQLYSNYDKSVADLVHLLRYPPIPGESRPVLHVFSTPERAFAQVERKLRNHPDDAQKIFPLVFLSIDRVDDAYDSRRASRARWRRMYYTADRTKYYGMDWPIPMILTYQISIWARQIRDVSDLIVQWLLLFDHTPLRYISVEHPFPMGTVIVPTKVTEITNVPMIPEAEKQRLVRKVITIEVEGWIIRPVVEVGIVEKITTYMYDSDDLETEGDLLGTSVVTSES